MNRPARLATGLRWAGALLIVSSTLASASQAERFDAEFLAIDEAGARIAAERPVGTFAGREEGLTHKLVLLLDGDGRPLLYYADIATPVCLDDLCEPVHVGLYWDLVGNYVGYGLPPDEPLTKFDHVPFSFADRVKLHEVLLDRESVLGESTLEEMFDPHAATDDRVLTYQGPYLDAVTGATSTRFGRAVVGGALYTCFTLWHLVHGDAAEQIRGHTRSLNDGSLTARFLASESEDYRRFAVESLAPDQWKQHLNEVLAILPSADSRTVGTILAHLPESLLRRPQVTRDLYGLFPRLDVAEKERFVARLPQAGSEAAEILARHVETMNKDQVRGYLAFLAEHPDRLSPPAEQVLRRIAEQDRYAYAYLVDAFLQSR